MLLLEQGQLSCGTTWHAAGLVGQLRASENGTRLVQYSTELYERLEQETGLATGFRRCGGVTVARTPERLVQLRRTAAAAEAYELECELISPRQARRALSDHGRRRPRRGDLAARRRPGQPDRPDLGAGPGRPRCAGSRCGSGPGSPASCTGAGAVTGVRTDQGDVEAEIVVNCAGQWAKQVGAMCRGDRAAALGRALLRGDRADRRACTADLPMLRDPDGYTYLKEEVGGLVVGGFEPEAKPWVAPDALPYPFEFQLLDEDWDHFSILMERRGRADPGAGRDRDQEVLQRPGELHPGQPVHPRRGPGAAELLRRRRVQLGRHRVGGRGGPGAGRVDHRGRAGPRPVRGRHPAVRPVQRQQPVAARPGRRGPRPALRGAVAEPGAGHRPAVPPVARLPPAGAGERVLRQPDGLGAGELLRPARPEPGDRVRLGRAELAALVRGRAARHPQRRGPVRPDLVLQVPADRAGRRAGAAVAVHRRRRGRSRAGPSTPGC